MRTDQKQLQFEQSEHTSNTNSKSTNSKTTYFLGRPIPHPFAFPFNKEGDMQFIQAVGRLFYDLVSLVTQQSQLGNLSYLYIDKLLKNRLRKTSSKERKKLIAWYSDNRFITFLALIETNIMNNTVFFKGMIKQLLSDHNATSEYAAAADELYVLHGHIAKWFSTIENDENHLSIIDSLIEIETENKNTDSIDSVYRLNNAKLCIAKQRKAYQKEFDKKKLFYQNKLVGKFNTLKFNTPSSINQAERAVYYFLHNAIQDVRLRVIDLCWFLVVQGSLLIEKYENNQKNKYQSKEINYGDKTYFKENEEFDWAAYFYDNVFSNTNVYGFQAIAVNDVHLWMQHYFLTLLTTLNTLCDLKENNTHFLLDQLDKSFGKPDPKLLQKELKFLAEIRAMLTKVLKKKKHNINLTSETKVASQLLAKIFFEIYREHQQYEQSKQQKKSLYFEQISKYEIRTNFLNSLNDNSQNKKYKFNNTGLSNGQLNDVSLTLISRLFDLKGVRKNLEEKLLQEYEENHKNEEQQLIEESEQIVMDNGKKSQERDEEILNKNNKLPQNNKKPLPQANASPNCLKVFLRIAVKALLTVKVIVLAIGGAVLIAPLTLLLIAFGKSTNKKVPVFVNPELKKSEPEENSGSDQVANQKKKTNWQMWRRKNESKNEFKLEIPSNEESKLTSDII